MVMSALKNVLTDPNLPKGTRLRIPDGAVAHVGHADTTSAQHLSPRCGRGDQPQGGTVALTDRGTCALGQAPAMIAFP